MLLKSCGPLIWRLSSLIALITLVRHSFIWGTQHRGPCLVDVYNSIPTFGSMASRIFWIYMIQYLSILLCWVYIFGLIVYHTCIAQILSRFYLKIIWTWTQVSGCLQLVWCPYLGALVYVRLDYAPPWHIHSVQISGMDCSYDPPIFLPNFGI